MPADTVIYIEVAIIALLLVIWFLWLLYVVLRGCEFECNGVCLKKNQHCCGGIIQDTPCCVLPCGKDCLDGKGQLCCGGEPYKPVEQNCCDDKLQTAPCEGEDGSDAVITPEAESLCASTCKNITDVEYCETEDYALCVAPCTIGIGTECVVECIPKIGPNYGNCVDKCYDKKVKVCENNCYDAIVQPCIYGLESACEWTCDTALLKTCSAIVKTAIKTLGVEAEFECPALCTECAVEAVALGGGPEDPAADAMAVLFESACLGACYSTEWIAGETITAFAEDLCHNMGI